MKVGPDISLVAALIGDPARTNMLMALLNGEAWAAGDLAREAGVTPATASCHLSKLLAGGLVRRSCQGRHRFYRLTNDDVGEALEVLLRIAARTGHTRHIVAPAEAPLRSARVCYDHLAGEYGVRLFGFLRASNYLVGQNEQLRLSASGEHFIERFGIRLEPLIGNRRPLCRLCLDWSERTHHLGGLLGAAILERMIELKWLNKQNDSRAVQFTSKGKKAFAELIVSGSA
jgi:DNA-binding transcriptional ArsR family regulator